MMNKAKRIFCKHMQLSKILLLHTSLLCAVSMTSMTQEENRAPLADPKKQEDAFDVSELLRAVKENDKNNVNRLIQKVIKEKFTIDRKLLSYVLLSIYTNLISDESKRVFFKKFENNPTLQNMFYSSIKSEYEKSFSDPDDFFYIEIASAFFNKFILQPITAYARSSAKNALNAFRLVIQNGDYHLLYPLLEIYKQFDHREREYLEKEFCQEVKKLHIPPKLLYGQDNQIQAYGDITLRLIKKSNEALTGIPSQYKHIPVMWITSGTESNPKERSLSHCSGHKLLSYESDQESMYAQLLGAILYSEILIISSRNITCKLLASAYDSVLIPNEKLIHLKNRIENDWTIYRVQDSQYCIWVPKKHNVQYTDLLNLTNLTAISTPDYKALGCPTMIANQDYSDNNPPYTESDPEKIFKPKDQYENDNNKVAMFDFYILGHGRAGTHVACIPIALHTPQQKRLTSLLTYLNENLSVGTIAISTCSAGGVSRALITKTSSGIPIQYNYNLILKSISDKPTISESQNAYTVIEKYFANAALLATGKITIDHLCKDLANLSATRKDAHGSANTSQILIPGMREFIGCNSDIVFQVSQDTVNSGIPIKIKNKQAALWYVNDIPQTVTVYRNQPKPLPSDAALPPIPSRPDDTQAASLIYPEFIPMDRGTYTLHFNHITVESDSTSGGILHFIRDAFLDVGPGPARFTTFIDQLDGLHDIVSPIQAGISVDTHGEAQEALNHWTATQGKQINLRNIVIDIMPSNTKKNSRTAFIYFPISGNANNTTLQYRVELVHSHASAKAQPWNVKILPAEDVPSLHDIPQVPLSDIERTFRILEKSGISQTLQEQAFDDFAKDAIRVTLNHMKDIHGTNITLPDTIDPSEIRNQNLYKGGYSAFEKTVPPEKLDEIVNQFNYLFQKTLATASEKSRSAILKAIMAKMKLHQDLPELQKKSPYDKLINAINKNDTEYIKNSMYKNNVQLQLLSAEERNRLYSELDKSATASYFILMKAIQEEDKETIENILNTGKIVVKNLSKSEKDRLYDTIILNGDRSYMRYVIRLIVKNELSKG